ncbi:hypothetical protein FRD82_21010, partial [Mycobacterium tuberculosis]
MGLSSDDTRRREVVRDLAAGALLIGALFFPWNLYFGFRIPDSSKTVLSGIRKPKYRFHGKNSAPM